MPFEGNLLQRIVSPPDDGGASLEAGLTFDGTWNLYLALQVNGDRIAEVTFTETEFPPLVESVAVLSGGGDQPPDIIRVKSADGEIVVYPADYYASVSFGSNLSQVTVVARLIPHMVASLLERAAYEQEHGRMPE